MGRRELRSERKLNIGKVIIVAILIIGAIVGIYFAVTKSKDNLSKKDNQKTEIQNENNEAHLGTEITTKTVEEVALEFGGEIKEKVKEDTCFVSKDGADYTVYKDGEIVTGKIIPWSGEEAKPAIDEAGNINIYSAAELAWVANRVISGEKNFSGVTITLRNHIDLGARKEEDGTWSGSNWNSIIGFLDGSKDGNSEVIVDETQDVTNENLKRFAGHFDGNGFSIRGMKIESNNKYQGLFGYQSGLISNLTIKFSYVKATESVGAIVGLNEGKVANCNVENTEIIASEKVGGVIGNAMTGSIIEDTGIDSNSKVNGKSYIGGIAGYINNNSTITNCSNSALVSGNEYVGGVTGIVFFGTTITNSSNYSKTIKGETYVGGIAGLSQAQIEKSNNQKIDNSNGNISGSDYIGGIVGLNHETGNITDSFNNGEIIVLKDNAGGIVGVNNGTISNCYNKGNIEIGEEAGVKIGGICGQNLSESFVNTSYNIGKINNINYAGGVVGADFGTVSKSFCLDTVLNKLNNDTSYNKTEDEMKNSIITELGDSFKTDSENINLGFPVLNWQ